MNIIETTDAEAIEKARKVLEHPGYKPPDREWYVSGECACGQCRWHPPRQCPAMAAYSSLIEISPSFIRAPTSVTLINSRERER
jgi:hypothetical protein